MLCSNAKNLQEISRSLLEELIVKLPYRRQHHSPYYVPVNVDTTGNERSHAT